MLIQKIQSVYFRPSWDIKRVTGSTPSAVPTTIIAMGRVAQSAEGASAKPTKLPTSMSMAVVEKAKVLVSASMMTLEKPRGMARNGSLDGGVDGTGIA